MPSLLTSLAILSTLLVPVYALIYRNKQAYKPYRILMANFIMAAVAEIVVMLVGITNHHNMHLINIFFIRILF